MTDNTLNTFANGMIKDVAETLRPEDSYEDAQDMKLNACNSASEYIISNVTTPVVVRKSWNSRSYFKGLVPEGSEELKGYANSNPVKDVKYICMLAPWSGTDDPVAVRVAFKIRYTVTFSAPKDIDPS